MIKDQISLEWKGFSIDLPSFDKHLRDTYASYVGNQGSNKLDLYFDDELAAQDKQDILDYYEALDETEEADKRALPSRMVGSTKSDFVKSKKELAVVKEWADMSAIERKLMSNMELSEAELDSLA